MMKQLKTNPLLQGEVISNLFYTMSYPVIGKTIISGITSNTMSTSYLISCIGGLLTGYLWKKHGDKLYEHWAKLLLLDIILFSSLVASLLIFKLDYTVYKLLESLMIATTVQNTVFGNNRLTAEYFDRDERVEFDDNRKILCKVTSIIGFGFGMLITLPMEIAILIFLFAANIDNVFYYIAYRNMKHKKLENRH